MATSVKIASQKEVNGKNVINFSVAHTERFKDAQELKGNEPRGLNALTGQTGQL